MSDVGLGERRLEQILAAEGDQPGDSGGAGIGVGFADPGRIDVDAEAAGAVAARGGDQDSAVARAEVDDIIVGPEAGEAEHGVDHLGGRTRHKARRAWAPARRKRPD